MAYESDLEIQVPDALILQRVGKETVANRAIAAIINDSLQIVSLFVP